MKDPFIIALVFAGSAIAQSGTFTPAGSMITARFGHTATLLQNGEVLIAGGNLSCALGASCLRATDAELYDPAAGTFRSAGTMSTIRPIGGVLLPDGRVLFAEGDPTGAPANIELYDPSSGAFKIGGASVSLALVSSAVLLNDGRVLLIGARGDRGSGAELYDALTESFSPVTNWPANVGFVSAEGVLLDGRVLLDLPALFDPVSGTLTSVSTHGWFNDTPPASLLLDGKMLLTGGNTDFGNVNWSELFDPRAGSFSTSGPMTVVRDAHTATLLPDGAVLVAGGASTFSAAANAEQVSVTAELYDPATRSFSLTGSLTTPRLNHAAVLLNDGRVLMTGGQSSIPPNGLFRSFVGTSSAELYTPSVLIPAPQLFSLSGDDQVQGAIWDAETGRIASPASPAAAGETLSLYTTNLAPNGSIPPRIAIGGRLAEVLFFGAAPDYPGYFQVNFRVPDGVATGPAVPVRVTYLSRPSNQVQIAVRP